MIELSVATTGIEEIVNYFDLRAIEELKNRNSIIVIKEEIRR